MRIVIVLCLGASVWAADPTVSEVARQLTQQLAAGKPDGGSDRIGFLVSRYAKGGAADRIIIVRTIGKAASAKNVEVRHAAFRALAKLQVAGSAKYLKRWLSPAPKGAVSESTFKAIEAAGEIADPALRGRLLKLIDHKNVEVAVVAIRALAGYRTLPVRSRKKLAMDLIGKLVQLSSGGTRGWGRAAAQSTKREIEQAGTPRGRPTSGMDAAERADHLRVALGRTLETLTGTRATSVAEWVGWRKRAKKLKDPFA